jgi:trk system potassium uptake protein TrkA
VTSPPGGFFRSTRMKRFVVVGLGNFGATVAESLHEHGHDVVALDSDEAKVDRIAPFVTRAAVGDGRQLKTLERVGAKGSDAGIVSTGDDITASILTTMALRDLKVPEIYVKVISRDHARVMEKIGVTETIFPERESAQRLGTRIASTGILNYIRMGTSLSIQEMAVPQSWIGRSLRALELPRKFRVSVIAVHDMLRDEMVVVPNPDAPLKDSDTLLIAGRDEDLANLASINERS